MAPTRRVLSQVAPGWLSEWQFVVLRAEEQAYTGLPADNARCVRHPLGNEEQVALLQKTGHDLASLAIRDQQLHLTLHDVLDLLLIVPLPALGGQSTARLVHPDAREGFCGLALAEEPVPLRQVVRALDHALADLLRGHHPIRSYHARLLVRSRILFDRRIVHLEVFVRARY